MERLVDVTVNIDRRFYEQAETRLREHGMSFEEAALLFSSEINRLGRLPFELTEEDWDIVRKLEEAEAETECTDIRYSSNEVLGAIKSEIKKSIEGGI